MTYPYNTALFINDVKNTAFFPVDQDTFTDQTILDIATSELYSDVFPLFKSFNEGFFLEPVLSNFVTAQATYELPKYAMWNAVYLVQRTLNGVPVYPNYNRIELGQLTEYQTNQQGTPQAYYLLDNTITFVPTPQLGVPNAYQLWIYRRPGRMVLTSRAATVLSVNTGTGVVTYTAAAPSVFTALGFYDFYHSQSPFRRFKTNIQSSALAGNLHTFPIADVQDIVPGDIISIVDETIFPPVPIEILPLITELTIKSLAKTQMDQEAYAVQKTEIMEKIKAAMVVPGNRTVGTAKPISLSNHPYFKNRNPY